MNQVCLFGLHLAHHFDRSAEDQKYLLKWLVLTNLAIILPIISSQGSYQLIDYRFLDILHIPLQPAVVTVHIIWDTGHASISPLTSLMFLE
jgi:hypothetical protein